MKTGKSAIWPKSGPNHNSCSIKSPTAGLLYNDFGLISRVIFLVSKEDIQERTKWRNCRLNDKNTDYQLGLAILAECMHKCNFQFMQWKFSQPYQINVFKVTLDSGIDVAPGTFGKNIDIPQTIKQRMFWTKYALPSLIRNVAPGKKFKI